jgi:hypothetical protein
MFKAYAALVAARAWQKLKDATVLEACQAIESAQRESHGEGAAVTQLLQVRCQSACARCAAVRCGLPPEATHRVVVWTFVPKLLPPDKVSPWSGAVVMSVTWHTNAQMAGGQKEDTAAMDAERVATANRWSSAHVPHRRCGACGSSTGGKGLSIIVADRGLRQLPLELWPWQLRVPGAPTPPAGARVINVEEQFVYHTCASRDCLKKARRSTARCPLRAVVNAAKKNAELAAHLADAKIQLPQQIVYACATCQKVSPDAKFCSRCRVARYCSQSCQKTHWKEHKPLCVPTNKAP